MALTDQDRQRLRVAASDTSAPLNAHERGKYRALRRSANAEDASLIDQAAEPPAKPAVPLTNAQKLAYRALASLPTSGDVA